MKTPFSAFLALLMVCSSANAEWRVETFKDRLTDRDFKVAYLPAQASDGGVEARLEAQCINGTPSLNLYLSERLYSREVGGAFRVDDKPEQVRFFRIFSDPNRVALLDTSPAQLARMKRYRIQLNPRGRPALFFDFALAGADKAQRELHCR